MSVSGVNVNEDMNKGKALPTGWRWVYLKDICSISANQVDPMLPEYSGLPHVGPENIESGSGKMMNVRSAATDGMISGKYLFKAGTVLYSKIRPYLRKAALAEMSGLCSADIYPLDTSNDIVDRQYFVWLLLSPNYTHFADSESRRARMPKINRDQLYSYRTILPPLAEQKRIAAILNEQMAAVERARTAAHAQLAAAKALPAAYFRTYFRGITPISTAPDRGKHSGPWKWKRLDDVARLESGHTPSRYHTEWWGGDVPWIALPDIRELDGKYALMTHEMTNNEGIANSSARILPTGTVCLSRTASVGFVTIMGRPMATSQDFVNWVCGPALDPDFLMYTLIAAREYILSLASGAVHKTVYMPTAREFCVYMPEISEQKRIVAELKEQLATTERTQAAAQAQLDEINALPAAILSRAFSGEL